jgi:hypothetical protein
MRAWELAASFAEQPRATLTNSRYLLIQPFKRRLLEDLRHRLCGCGVVLAASASDSNTDYRLFGPNVNKTLKPTSRGAPGIAMFVPIPSRPTYRVT